MIKHRKTNVYWYILLFRTFSFPHISIYLTYLASLCLDFNIETESHAEIRAIA